MKLIARIAVSLCFAAGLAVPAFAHPPKDFIVEYDNQNKILKILVQHQVTNPASHFVEWLTVDLNKKNMIKQNFSSQRSKDLQDALYVFIDAKPADEITVSAQCNVMGGLKKTYTVRDITKK
jgi:desulfoferrodoxin (superoxide reductase-like protein)